MIWLFFALSVIHVCFYLILTIRWRRITVSNTIESSANHFSIIIPARNEEHNILTILSDLEKQSFNKQSFEVIVVNDFSTDKTEEVVARELNRSTCNLKLISLSEGDFPGKKTALTKGIEQAKHELILTTDADCQLGKDWVASYDQVFEKGVQIVAGPVVLDGKGLFSAMQKVEFVGLVAFGAVTLDANNPSMCSGANLGFRKAAFYEVGGYQGNIHLPSGDDEFLLYDILQKHRSSGRFLKSTSAIVNTKTHQSFPSFFNQRARWISKWKYNKNPKLKAMAVLFFFDYLAFLLAMVAFFNGQERLSILGVGGVRFLSNFLFIASLRSFLHTKSWAVALFLLQIFYPFHVLFMGVLSIFGRYTWKGRRY